MRIIAIIAALAFASPAIAENSSAYTKFKLENCRVIKKANGEADASDTWSCKGFKGKPEYEIVYYEGDLRGFMPIGIDAMQHCTANQTFSGFNSAGTTVEWRLKDGKPIAAIVRWTVSYDPEDSTKTKTWLVVTKLEPRNSCRMALVEGALPNANAEARKVADQFAPLYKCEADAEKIIALPATNKNDMIDTVCERH